MGLIEMKNRLTISKNQRDIVKNESALAPVIWGLLILGTVIATAGTYAYFSQPDITYNVAEGGLFNIAGVELSSLEVIAVAMGVLLTIAFLFKRNK